MKKLLVNQVIRHYTKHPKELASQLNKLSQKFKMTQKVQDKVNTQRLLETQIKEGKLVETIERTQKYDQQFSEFLKNYREQHKDIANIIDMSHYARSHNPFDKDQKERREEIEMLEQFRKRQDDRNKQIQRGSAMAEHMGYMDIEEGEDSEQEVDINSASEDEEECKDSRKNVKQEVSQLYEKDEFTLLVLDQGVTTLITKLNRINHFRALVFMGNGKGIIGYGQGKGNDFQLALDNAIRNCKKNLIVIPLDDQLTWLQGINVKYNGFRMRLWSRPRLGMNPWGSPLMVYMLNLAGIRDVSFKIISKNIDPYAMTYAFFKAMTKNQTPKQWSEKLGRKIYHENFGKPYYVDINNPNKVKHFY